jgi:hypothetical protein
MGQIAAALPANTEATNLELAPLRFERSSDLAIRRSYPYFVDIPDVNNILAAFRWLNSNIERGEWRELQVGAPWRFYFKNEAAMEEFSQFVGSLTTR